MAEKISILKNPDPRPIRNRVYIATPTLGVVRAEWAQARWAATTPCNWTNSGSFYAYSQNFIMGYLVAEAQNVAVEDAIKHNAEWLILLEDDVVIPPDFFLRFNQYMKEEKIPVVSGLYFSKGTYSEPLAYRGRGNSCYDKFKLGDKVWLDGVPTGCLLIHMSLLRLMHKESEPYMTAFGRAVHRVFETPSRAWTDPETGIGKQEGGTSDLYWCDTVIKNKVLERAGWKKISGKEYPFLMDTNILCGHIDLTSGKVYQISEDAIVKDTD